MVDFCLNFLVKIEFKFYVSNHDTYLLFYTKEISFIFYKKLEEFIININLVTPKKITK